MGPFPVTSRGNRHILVLTDLFTKYIEVVPVPSQTAEQCAKIVVDHVVNRWGTPLAIHSDQGTAFESRLFKELCELLAVKKTRTSARNPQGNGQVERANRTIVKMVRAFLSEEQDDWDVHLGCIANAYRATPHQATKLSPNMLALGREVRLPADLQYPTVRDSDEHIRSEAEYIVSLRQTMQRAHEVARTHLGKEAERSKEVYDRRLAFTKYKMKASNGGIMWQCARCGKQDRKNRMAAHILKDHIPLHQVPYHCLLCQFRCQDSSTLRDHVSRYSRHVNQEKNMRKPINYAQYLIKAERPIHVTSHDMFQVADRLSIDLLRDDSDGENQPPSM
ncbi:protein NYNRIN-like [Mya arenaria]|uniref:protein NYNRIN-like n=1 Tax=Mya arenaria TaxID=6604 RepID=UPI0022E0EF13|nr:protein NYNRIN-like [Mya arenaria]